MHALGILFAFLSTMDDQGGHNMATIDNPVILVVEDDPPVRDLLDDVLKDEGYAVVAVHDGATALQVITSLRVDLITLDLDLPGLTGSELLQILRTRKVQIPPVVVVTAEKPVRRKVRQMAQAVVLKPFDVDELVREVLRLLPRRTAHAQARLDQLNETLKERRAGRE